MIRTYVDFYFFNVSQTAPLKYMTASLFVFSAPILVMPPNTLSAVLYQK